MKIISEIKDQIIKDYNTGESVESIRKQYNLSTGTVRNLLINSGVTLRTRKEARNSKNYAEKFGKSRCFCSNEVERHDIIDSYLRLDSSEIISTRYGVTPRTIRLFLLKQGIQLRTAKESAQSQLVKQRKEDANLAKRGVRNPRQDPAIFEKGIKSGFKRYSYTKNSKIFNNLQGYEKYGIDYAVDILGIPADHIIAGEPSKIPCINYTFCNTTHVYYPDIFITPTNTLIEVKSCYVFKQTELVTHAKQQASKDSGFNHIVLIFSAPGVIDQII